MSRGGVASEPVQLQALDKCNICSIRGKDIIKHYVEHHPGVEIPVHLTSKELLSLKTSAKAPPASNSLKNHEDKENILIEFLKNLGPEATFANPVECPLCTYHTVSRSDMMNHLLIHQNVNFVCYFCPTSETNLNDFRDHVSTHTGEYAYQCIHCSFRGAHSTDVARHITVSHPGKEAKTIFENVAQSDGDSLKGYACSYCGYIQMSKAVMEKHVASVDTFCRGSSVIEFDLSRGRSSTARSAVVKEGSTSNARPSSAQLPADSQNRVYIQDEIEIEPNEPAASDSILPFNEEQNRGGWNPVLKIKTEKIDDGYNRQSVTNNSSVVSSTSSVNVTASRSNSPAVNQYALQSSQVSNTRTVQSAQVDSSRNEPSSGDAPKEPRPFVCASCQFNTKDETEFIKHARTDHRTDLSLWCKSCGKCFSNAGVLVTHIKEGTCEKEELVYRCGVKECTFETPSGQTFVHHLRHCHKTSPFIFCVHCQKIFTLPHCLILHMQNDCPYKERNRKYPGQVSSETPPSTSSSSSSNLADKIVATKPAATPTVQTVSQARPILPRPPAPNIVNQKISLATGKGRGDSRGRVPRGRGKGRGRSRFVESESDSDPDDPSWTPEETPSSKPVRRSARFRKNDDSFENEAEHNESKSKAEPVVHSQSRNEEFLSHAVTCPSCDFSTLSKTLLEDHYVSEHKKTDKNQCKVCSVKFETITAFTEHFETMHRKEIVLPEKAIAAKSVVQAPADAPTVSTQLEKGGSAPSENDSADLSSTAEKSDSIVKIPYQTAIHEKNQKDAKLKNFEELKAPNDIVKMKEELKLKHFFKCMLWNCTFTTDNSSFFVSHLSDNHSGKKLYCSFCFREFSSATLLTNHMLLVHSKRCYQCSACFYRAFSKPHVQIHIKYNHSKETAVIYTSTTHLSNDIPPPPEESEEEVVQTTWPYHCAIGECKFKTFDPKDFKKHNEITHRAVSVFICYYCKAEFISFKRLMNHYRLHGINNYQCTFCLHGSDTKDEILAHLSQNHADKPFQVHVRASQEGPFNKDAKSPESTDPLINLADSNRNQSSSKSDTPDRAQKKYGKQVKSADSSEVPIVPPVPVEKIKKEEDKTKPLVGKCVYEKVYPHHVSDFESKFSCGIPTCDKEFQEMDVYLKHLQHNHIAMNIICPYCLEVTESEFDFKNHLSNHGPNLFACSNECCYYNNWKRDEVVQHMKTQHGTGDHVITVRQKELNASFVMKLPDIPCSEEKKDLDNLQEGFLCPFCGYKSKNRVMMKKHIYREFEYMRFQCSYCDTKFCCQKDIRLHFLSEHPNEDINATLDMNAEVEHRVKAFLFCHQNMVSTEVKSNSSKVASVGMKPTLYCADCGKKFFRARDWHEHLKLCLIRQFDDKVLEFVECLACGSKFTDLNLLKIHFSSAHYGKQLCFVEKPNRMEWLREMLLCLRLQYVENAVDDLIKLSSGTVLTDLLGWKTQCKLETKEYKCCYCTFKNSFKFNVERHLASSHSGKPIKIDRLTSRVFGYNSKEAKDKGEKAEVTAYCCSLCLKKFSSIDTLKLHLLSNHSEYQNVDSYHLYAPSYDATLMANKEKKYECLYCSSGKQVFSEIKLHYEKCHPTSQFKVKGFLCGSKRKRGTNSNAGKEPPSKKPRADGESLFCCHCSKPFLSLEELCTHCHIIHPCLPVKYESRPAPEVSGVGSHGAPVCISLSALGKEIDTSEASSSKGGESSKWKFNCNQCGAAFRSSYQMEQHLASQHGQNMRKCSKKDPPLYNLDKITVCVEHKDIGTMRLSASYFAQAFNIFPRVQVRDFEKEKVNF